MSDSLSPQLLRLRKQVLRDLTQHLATRNDTNVALSELLKITPARVSSLMRGDAEAFRLDMLLTLALRAGLKPAIALHSPAGKSP